jgi:hypothetical protein
VSNSRSLADLERNPRENTKGFEYGTGDLHLLTGVGLEEALAGAEGQGVPRWRQHESSRGLRGTDGGVGRMGSA